MSIELLEIGTEVRMSAVGKAKYRDRANNPHDLVGRIVEHKSYEWDRDFAYLVEWENTQSNSYRPLEVEQVGGNTFKGLLREEVAKRAAMAENCIRDEQAKLERLSNIVESFQVLKPCEDELRSGDILVYVNLSDDICVDTSDEEQLHPDSDGDFSVDGGYVHKDSIKVAIRAEGLTEHMLTTEMLQQLVDEYSTESVELSPEAMKTLRDFGGTSAVDFVNKIRKTRNKDLTKVLEALDEILK